MWIKLPKTFQLKSWNKTDLNTIHWKEMMLKILNWNNIIIYTISSYENNIDQYEESQETKCDN